MVKKKTYRKSHKRKLKKPFYRNKFFLLTTTVLFVSCLLLYLLFFLNFFWIKNIEISGNQRISEQELESFLEEKISKKIFLLESRSVFLFYPSSIAQEALERFPATTAVKINRRYPDEVSLEIKERKEIGTLCQEQCYLIDSKGFIFQETEKRKALNIEKQLTQYPLGRKVVSSSDMDFIIYIWNNLGEAIDIDKFNINGFNLTVTTRENWLIKFNLREQASLQEIRLKTVLEEKIPKEKRKNLEYVDLRFKGVYFKYR
jgi:hypothetical protein